MNAHPDVIVTWDDAFQSDGQHTVVSLPAGPLRVKTRGLLLQDNEIGVWVASEVLPDEQPPAYRGVTMIPRCLVRNIEHLSKPRKPRVKKPIMQTEEAPVVT